MTEAGKEKKGKEKDKFRPVLRMSPSRATAKVPMLAEVRQSREFAHRVAARLMTAEDFIQNHASGTLRKNKRIGMDATGHYLHERVAFEFGYGFESIHETRVTWGTPISIPDCHPVTEAGWHIDRYVEVCGFPGDEFETKYIQVEYPDGTRHEGLGVVVRKTSATFVPEAHMVFAIIAEWSLKKNRFKRTLNPC